jgi:hypothetical protein
LILLKNAHATFKEKTLLLKNAHATFKEKTLLLKNAHATFKEKTLLLKTPMSFLALPYLYYMCEVPKNSPCHF